MESVLLLSDPRGVSAMGAAVERTEPSPQPPAASAAATEAVLGDDDLLREILLRLGFPTCLVRAAAVCKRWLRHASNPAFLRRFRDLNPPRLLGFYITSLQDCWRVVDFVPMLPQPPELASVLRHGCFSLDAYGGPAIHLTVTDCQNGSVFIKTFNSAENKLINGVHTPLHPARGLVTIPEIQIEKDPSCCYSFLFLSKEVGDGQLAYFWLVMEFKFNRGNQVYIYMLQDNVWCMLISATAQLNYWPPKPWNNFRNNLIVEDKVYVAAAATSILVLDLTSSSCSTIKLPDGVFNEGDTVLSRANDFGVYLVHLKELQLYFWLLAGTNGSVGDWLLVDTISLGDMCDNLRLTNCTVEDGHNTAVCIKAVGDNAEFVFLVMGQCILYFDVRSRTLRQVYEKREYYHSHGCWIFPYMMIWPPTFPVLKE